MKSIVISSVPTASMKIHQILMKTVCSQLVLISSGSSWFSSVLTDNTKLHRTLTRPACLPACLPARLPACPPARPPNPSGYFLHLGHIIMLANSSLLLFHDHLIRRYVTSTVDTKHTVSYGPSSRSCYIIISTWKSPKYPANITSFIWLHHHQFF
jgi:hypothetical protein